MNNSYPGGKGGDGVYQAIINQIPPHDVYIEPFLGGGAIMRHKLPAPVLNIGVDADSAALESFRCSAPALSLIHGDAIRYLENCGHARERSTFVYCDPPYPMFTRSTQRSIYACEMTGPEEHARLLRVLRSLPCMVAISSYPNGLYDSLLPGWRSITFPAMTRGGRRATEKLWMNYPEPTQLHDYRYLGADYRERERIKKKKNRWRARLERMPAQERYALLSTIKELWE